MASRSVRRAQAERQRVVSGQAGPGKLRVVAFAAVALAIVAAGLFMAGSVFLGQRDRTDVAGSISMRISMDGFEPGTLEAAPGQTLTLDWWNQDEAMHLSGGVHTLVSDTLGVDYALPAQSRETIELKAPTTPGDYDFWCDSCCGGKDNPRMHGKLHVGVQS